VNWSLFVAAARPAARQFVQDAQSGMRLAESGVETKSRPTFCQSHATLRIANESPSSRSTAVTSPGKSIAAAA